MMITAGIYAFVVAGVAAAVHGAAAVAANVAAEDAEVELMKVDTACWKGVPVPADMGILLNMLHRPVK